MRVSKQDRTQDGVSTGALLARRARTLAGSTAIVSVWTLLLAATLLPCAGRAQDATWGANPTSGDWNTAANWSPGTVPTGTATFGSSSQTTIGFSQFDTTIGTMQFNSGAPAYTFVLAQPVNLTDKGIINNSGSAPIFIGAGGGLLFRNASTAGNATIITGDLLVRFKDTSTAGNAAITNTGDSLLEFQDTSSAGNATIINKDRAVMSFRGDSTAGNATITNSAHLFFDGNSDAGNAVITNNAGGQTTYTSAAPGGSATIINNTGGVTDFGGSRLDVSPAAHGTIINNAGGRTEFHGRGSGGDARFITNAGGVFDMSALSSTGMTAGSIEGAGSYFLGSQSLTVGSNDRSTLVSGGIADGGGSGGIGGGVVKVGTGMLTLSGVNSFTGATTINAGTLVVNGSIATSSLTTVNSGGTLAGTGTVGAMAVAAGGTMAPGDSSIATLNVAGNLAFAPSAFYAVDLNAAGRSDKIAASGAANLSGGTVQVTPMNGFAVNTPYTILTATGGVTGGFAALAGPSFTFLAPTLTYDPNDVFVTFARNNVSFASVGQTRNQVATGAGLDSLGRGPAFNVVAASSTPAQARVAFDQLSGEVHASAVGVMLDESRYVRDAVMGHLRQPFGRPDGSYAALAPFGSQAVAVDGSGALGYASEPAFKAAPRAAPQERITTAWAQAVGDWGRTDSDGNAARLRRATGGVISGVDATFEERWRLGFAGGYTQSLLNIDDRRSSATINNYHLALYGGGELGAWALRGGAALTWHTIDSERTIVFPAFFDSAKASYDARTAQMFGEVARGFALGKMTLEPFAGLAYVHLDTGHFAETGGAALTGGGDAFATTFSTLGLHGASAVTLPDGKQLSVRGTLGWRHAFGDVTPETLLAFSGGGTPFTVAGVPIAGDALLVEAGAGFNFARNASIGLTYSGQLARAAQDHAAKGEINWKF
jgi:outer membrane autotransporter protein